jgi:uncharacterized repeat protein (TIGR03803 family)
MNTPLNTVIFAKARHAAFELRWSGNSMFRNPGIFGRWILGLGVVTAMAAPLDGATAASLKVVYSFRSGKDGSFPAASLIVDKAGNFYGTTFEGGGNACEVGDCGTVFKLTPDGKETMLYAFKGGSDGASPAAALIMDSAGNLFGTTLYGGGSGCNDGEGAGCGTVFKLTPNGTESVLYSFTGGADGAQPEAALIEDKHGNLYGTTPYGGANNFGTVFKVATDGSETVLHSFTNGDDGGYPYAGMIADKSGNLYGTTRSGGSNAGGTIFEIQNSGKETVLYNFCSQPNCADGAGPRATLSADGVGNFYGTTQGGGDSNNGTVFRLAPNDAETVLYSFQGGNDGYWPIGGVVGDNKGNLFGTTEFGGTGQQGTIFKVAPDGAEHVLHDFQAGTDGANPNTGLIIGNGYLYGTMSTAGKHGQGSVYKIKD